MFFCKERKRMQRTQHSFAKNVKEHKACNILLQKNVKERKERNVLMQKNAERCVLLKRTHAHPFISPVSRLRSYVSYLTSPVSCLTSPVSCLMSTVSCLLSHFSCTTFTSSISRFRCQSPSLSINLDFLCFKLDSQIWLKNGAELPPHHFLHLRHRDVCYLF